MMREENVYNSHTNVFHFKRGIAQLKVYKMFAQRDLKIPESKNAC